MALLRLPSSAVWQTWCVLIWSRKRTKLPLSSQIAVYTVERMFDLGAMALIFSSALLLAPDRATLPHHEALQHAALGGLVVAVALAIFAVSRACFW